MYLESNSTILFTISLEFIFGDAESIFLDIRSNTSFIYRSFVASIPCNKLIGRGKSTGLNPEWQIGAISIPRPHPAPHSKLIQGLLILYGLQNNNIAAHSLNPVVILSSQFVPRAMLDESDETKTVTMPRNFSSISFLKI